MWKNTAEARSGQPPVRERAWGEIQTATSARAVGYESPAVSHTVIRRTGGTDSAGKGTELEVSDSAGKGTKLEVSASAGKGTELNPRRH